MANYYLVSKLWTDWLVSMREDDHGWTPYCIIKTDIEKALELSNIKVPVERVWGFNELPLYQIREIPFVNDVSLLKSGDKHEL